MKTCATCHRLLPAGAFNRRRAASDGLQARCRDCSRAWYVANAVQHRRNAAARQKRVVAESKRALLEHLLRNPCVDCGERDVRVLELDHRPGTDKHANVVELVLGGFSWRRIEAEIAKCDVRCANCHRRRTCKEGGWWREEAEAARSAEVAAGAARRLANVMETADPRG